MKTTDARPVLDGRKVRWTLEERFQHSQTKVFVDWLRFTLPLDAVVRVDKALPPDLNALAMMPKEARDLIRQCRGADASLDYTNPAAVARSGAGFVCRLLGMFELGQVEDKGMDYYLGRAAVMHEGAAVGWVLAGGRAQAQASTVHVNLFGSACRHVSHEKWAQVAAWIESVGGWITRVDLALDLFAGLDMESVRAGYLGGAFDVKGKRPGQVEHGSWTLGHDRTFEVGSRATGKVCRVYEKGDELLGHEANDPMVRVEVEFRSNHRVIDLAVLTRPADFFAGAYPYSAERLAEVMEGVEPESIRTVAQTVEKNVDAAAVRVVRWLTKTAGPALAHVFWDGGDLIAQIVEQQAGRMPKRFVGFSRQAISAALEKVAGGLTPSPAPFANGVA